MGQFDGGARSRMAAIVAVIAVIVAVTCIVAATRWMVGPDGPVHEAVGTPDATPDAAIAPAVGADGLLPAQIALPTVGVEASVKPQASATSYAPALGRDLTTFALPAERTSAAWWSNGPRPGAHGLSVILGRSGDQRGPGVFDGISQMARGDKIILRSSGSEIVTYLVSDVVSGVRATDPGALKRAQVTTRPVAKAVALVAYGDPSGAEQLGRAADVVVFGHLRSN